MLVLSLVQSVGIDEQGLALDGVYLLTDVLQLGPQADRGIGLDVDERAVLGIATQDGRVVASVAEPQVAALQVDQSDEHGDKHTLLVVGSQFGIQSGGYLRWHHGLFRQRVEQSGGLCHEQRGRHSLARHVADAEVQAVALKQIAVQVATHLAGGRHRGIQVEIGTLGELVGYHAHLDGTGNAQLRLDALLGSLHLGHALGGAVAEVDEDAEESHHQHKGHQRRYQPLVTQRGFLLGNLGFFLLRLVDDGQLGSIVATRDGVDGTEICYDALSSL